MGVLILGAFALYFIISLVLVVLAARAAKLRGRSPWRWGGAVAFVMYLLVFWDHIPTVVAHINYCQKDAGVWVYRSADEWKKQNPGALDAIAAPKTSVSPTRHQEADDGRTKIVTYVLNERFNWIVIQRDVSNLLPIIRTEEQLEDVKTNEVLARYVDFSTGNSVRNTIGPPGPLKFWISNRHCPDGSRNQDALRRLRDEFYGGRK